MTGDEIAAAFVACKHWRWVDGMRQNRDDGAYMRLAPHVLWIVDGRSDVRPDIEDAPTLGAIEHDLLPSAWAHVGDRVAIEVVHGHAIDARAGTLTAAVRCRVLVWTPGTWREHWSSPACATKAEALLRCLEAA